MAVEDHGAEIEAWASKRREALCAPDGWLNLTDRIEAPVGQHEVGTDPACAMQISAGPARLGTLVIAPDGAAALIREGARLTFEPAPEAPPRLTVAGLLLEIMTVEATRYLRVRDLSHPRRANPPRLPRYPVSAAWRLRADWHVYDQPKQAAIRLVGGAGSMVTLTHEARFSYEGQAVALLATHWKAGLPMFVFRDATSGGETYGASRFLIAEPQSDQILLDFNKAFSPPCAFSEHAVCPLPPRQNILPFAIRAGEMLPE